MNLQGNIRNAYSASDHAGLLHSTRVISFGYVNPFNGSNVEGEGRQENVSTCVWSKLKLRVYK